MSFANPTPSASTCQLEAAVHVRESLGLALVWLRRLEALERSPALSVALERVRLAEQLAGAQVELAMLGVSR